MNVMAEAHKQVRELLAVRPNIAYRVAFVLALINAHREYKAMNAQIPRKVQFVFENVNTHGLAEGDEIMHYGVILKLKNRKEWPMRAGDCPNMQGVCITFDTDLIWHPDFDMKPGDEPYYAFPIHWAKAYGVQGNKLAVWSKITSREKF